MRIHVLVLLSTLALSVPASATIPLSFPAAAPPATAKAQIAKPAKVSRIDKLADYRNSRKEVEGFIRYAGPQAVNARTGAIKNNPNNLMSKVAKVAGVGMMGISAALMVGGAAIQNPALSLSAGGFGAMGGIGGAVMIAEGFEMADRIRQKANSMALAVAAKFGHKPKASDKARWKLANVIE